MEFKVGGKITLSENEKYYIIEITEYKGNQYLFCTTAQGKVQPALLQVEEIDGEMMVRLEENPLIIYEISKKILERDDPETLKKLIEKK